MLRFTTLAALATASSLTALAQAAEDATDRQDTVYVEGLRPTEIADTTGAIITLKTDIRDTINPVDTLRAAPGVAISRSGSLGGLTQVRIRGAEANHTLTTYEGIEISDPVNGETDFGMLSALPVGQIDVLRGPASSIHGSDAIGGVVALRARGAASPVSGFFEGGTFDTLNGGLMLNALPASDTSTLLASITGATTRGVDTSGQEAEKDGSNALSAQITGKTTLANWSVTGLGLVRQSNVETDSDTDFDGLLNNVEQETDSVQHLLGLNLARDYGQFDHSVTASYNKVNRENTSNDVYTGETEGTRTKVSWSPSFDIYENNTHRITGLAEWEREEYERLSTDTLFGDPNQSADFTSQALAAEYRYTGDALTLTASARQDFNDSQFDDATTWRIGGAYQVFDGLRLRASGGEAVKNPTFTELFGFFPASFIGNPDLQPESSLGWDIGVDHAFALGNANINLSATYFDATLEDEIVTLFNPDFTSSPANSTFGDSQRSGVELTAAIDWTTVGLNAQYTNTTSENGADTPEIRVPEHTASLSADWQMDAQAWIPNARLTGALDYVGEQLDTDFGLFRSVTLDDYTLASARLDIPFSEKGSFTLRGENLFDETVTDVFGYHTRGAGVYIGFTFR